MADNRELTFGMDFNLEDALNRLGETIDRLEGVVDRAEEAEDAAQGMGSQIKAGMGSVIDAAEDAADSMGDVTKATDRAGDSFGDLEDDTDDVREGFRDMGREADSFGSAVGQAMGTALKESNSATKGIRAGFDGAIGYTQKKFDTFTKKATTGIKGIGTAITHPIKTIKGKFVEALTHASTKLQDMGDEADNTKQDLEEMGAAGEKAGNQIGDAIKGAVTAFVGFEAIKKGIDLLKDLGAAAIEAAGAAESVGKKFDAVFADTDAAEWVENYADAVHRTTAEVQGFMVSNKKMYADMGITGDAATELSKLTTSLAYDIGNAFSMDDAEALGVLQDYIGGNTKALEEYGVHIDDAALKASAMAMGLGDQIDKLDDAAMAQVRMNALLEKSDQIQQAAIKDTGGLVNSTKSLKGVWGEFLADAGQKFVPMLESLMGCILDNWPTIEPMLMGLVEILSDGLAQAMPIIMKLGQTLLPVLTNVLGTVFEAASPLLSIFADLAQTILPPLASIIGELAEIVIPPLVQIFDFLNVNVIQPLMPIIQEVAGQLLPVLGMALESVMSILGPLVEAFMPLLESVLPVLGSLISELAGAILPPLTEILGVVIQAVTPIVEVVGEFAQAILPALSPLISAVGQILSGVILPVVEAVSPILSIIADVLGTVVGWISDLIGFVANGVSKVVNFFSSIFGGAKESTDAVEDLNGAVNGLDEATNKETSLAVDTADYKDSVEGAAKTTTAAVTKSSNEAKEITDVNFMAMGASASAAYGTMQVDAETAWSKMQQAAETGADNIVKAIERIQTAAQSAATATGNIQVGTSVPHNARGTDNFGGGLTWMNEEGGELAVLPNGSAIVPADQTDRLMKSYSSTTNNVDSSHSSSVSMSPSIQITIQGNADAGTVNDLEARLRALFQELYQEAQEQDYADRAMQAGYA